MGCVAGTREQPQQAPEAHKTHHHHTPSSAAAGGSFRLRAGPMNLTNVGNLCGRLQTAGLDCIVVGNGR